MNFDAQSIQWMLTCAPVILFSLTVHEFMHAWSAWKCGDDTALRAGRVTLNPLAHLELLGTILLFFGPIGWAKPVPVNPGNFPYDTRRRDEILVSGAGVAANFVLGFVFAMIIRFFTPQILEWHGVGPILWAMVWYGAFINFGLALFNLLPIFPLDGSHILQNLLPLNAAIVFASWRVYGPIVLVAFIVASRVCASWFGFSFVSYPVSCIVDYLTNTGP